MVSVLSRFGFGLCCYGSEHLGSYLIYINYKLKIKNRMEENVNFDNEVLAYLSTRKDQLIEQHGEFISSHPEIREVLNDFLSSVLLHKPDNVFVYAKEYFHPFNPSP
jgi:hypothetical protein